MKQIKKKFSVEATVGAQVTLSDLLGASGRVEIDVDGHEVHPKTDDVKVKVGGKYVDPSSIVLTFTMCADDIRNHLECVAGDMPDEQLRLG